MLRSSQALTNVDPGFRQPADVLSLGVFVTAGDIPDPEDAACVQEQIARRPALIGLPIGLVMAFGLTRLMAGLLYGVSALDPVTFIVVPAGLLLVTLLASYVPARRAARIDPMAALRAE